MQPFDTKDLKIFYTEGGGLTHPLETAEPGPSFNVR